MAILFRDKAPVRTCKKTYSDYRAYKPFLSVDFNHHCGYTHTSDVWFGGSRTFQIDHIKPKDKYPDKENDYNNLVYCCSYVNRAKWDDDSPNYLDPCLVDYNNHFERDGEGRISAKTDPARYMIKKMHLDLMRYAWAWKLEQLDLRIDRLVQLIDKKPELRPILTDILIAFRQYVKKFQATL